SLAWSSEAARAAAASKKNESGDESPHSKIPPRALELIDLLNDTAENFALPVELVHGPAVDGPAGFADDLWPAVLVDVTLALRLSRFKSAAGRPGVAAPPCDLVVVHNRDDARVRQIDKTQRDDFVAGRAVPLLQRQQV